MKKYIKLWIGVCVFVLILFSINPIFAVSDTTNVSVLIQGGSLGITTPTATLNLGMVAIDGTTKNVSANLGTMSVMDLTGSGSGWNVTVEATRFSNGTDDMPYSSLKLVGIKTISPVGTTSPMPNIVGTGPYVLDGGGATKILSATTNNGMGKYDVDFLDNALNLTINTNQIKASSVPYTSLITWTIVTGP